jgi:Swt1-like HEPN
MNERLALFLMMGQTAQRSIRNLPNTVPQSRLMISSTFNVSEVLPEEAREAVDVAETFKLFYVLENYLRDFILNVLSESDKDNWWSAVPKDVQNKVAEFESTEESKQWMNLNPRGRLALTTLPQLLRIIDEDTNWKTHFERLVRDKALITQTRLIVHTRNTICHMSPVTTEEHGRIQQIMRDWFRVIAP